MTTLTQDLKDKLQRLNILEKIIAINVVVFVVGFIIEKVLSLPEVTSLNWIELPENFFEVLSKPWSILTYGFAHYSFWHILLNMIVLYFVAQMFSNLFSTKMSLNIYFLGIISGALFYLVVYNLVPSQFLKTTLGLVGASAGIRALLIFLCTYMPNRDVRFFTFNIKLMYIGVVLVLLDFIGLFGMEQGGNVAHLGGDLLGYYYAKQLTKGNDIGKGFERIMDAVFNMFKGVKKSPLKTVHKNKSKVGGYTKADFNQFNNQKKIDIILDKISKSGYDSLTAEEKEFLFKAGK